jgi:predicted GTPase
MSKIIFVCFLFNSLRDLFTEDSDEIDDTSYRHTIQNFCLYVTHQWLKESQRVNKAVSRFIEMRRENVAIMIKSAMPICSEDEVEAIVTHDDGMHVHKLITAVTNVSYCVNTVLLSCGA